MPVLGTRRNGRKVGSRRLFRRAAGDRYIPFSLTVRGLAGLAVWTVLATSGDHAAAADAAVDYRREVYPILADACLHCHGPDAASRAAELRLDDRDDATRERDGRQVISPGHPEQSELLARICSRDADMKMPPVDEPRQLSAEEIALLRRWIAEGAEYGSHWAFEAPVRVNPPSDESGWSVNAIDAFVLARMRAAGLAPAARAERTTLVRRVSLDLTGLPPTPREVEEFLADDGPAAYERFVDKLLASPRYGERRAAQWMDLARYADSGGYQGDIPRTMWPWRDWVIEAYNAGVPFDRFTVEQLAGDLLPEATPEQIIATGFNRNHRINDEDGIIPEEFRVEYVVDRVEATSATWLGLTMGCARCHDHKYDPISQRDFYRFFAYFNSVDEHGRGYGNSQPLYYFDPAVRERIEEIDRELIALGDAAQGEYQKLIDLKRERDAILAESVTTMVMRDLPEPRRTYVLERGQYDRCGEEVTPGVPDFLPPLAENSTANRLALARWIVDPQNPLTARVAVNRVWQTYFGRGLVETPEDFGTRGAAPSHRELLDWLATEFVTSGWDVKGLHRLIVTSATYQQASDVDEARYRRDPENRWLARAPRRRLDAEVVRDQALAAAGLLDDRLGGPSVKPYQPDGVWREMVSAFPDYEQSHGADLYRRSLYTFIRRTVQPPAMNAFDLPSRETCQVRRSRTNTPLQALVAMNDPTYLEAARVLAVRTMTGSSGATDAAWIDEVFGRVLARSPREREVELLTGYLRQLRTGSAGDAELGREFTSIGEASVAEVDQPDLAARTAVVSLILNLDETLNRE